MGIAVTPSAFEKTSLTIRPWPDPVIDTLGHDPRSAYVETFWLGVLGPSTTWLLRRIVTELERAPSGFELDLPTTARQLGLGDKGGRTSPFVRALGRLLQFDLAQLHPDDALAVRRHVPPLSRRQVIRLPESLQHAHQAWLEGAARMPQVEVMRRRARQLALSLLELGEGLEDMERQLLRWRYHPAMAREAAAWAWDRHVAAHGEPDAGPPSPTAERKLTAPTPATPRVGVGAAPAEPARLRPVRVGGDAA